MKYILTSWSYPIGFFMGIAWQLITNHNEEFYKNALSIISNLSTYAFLPFLLTSLSIFTAKLLEKRNLFQLLLQNLYIIITTNLIASLLAGLTILIYIPAKIQITPQIGESISVFSWTTFLNSLFPESLISLLIKPQLYLFQIIFFLIFLGISLHFTQDKTHILKELLSSGSRVFYHMNTLIVQIFSVPFIFLSGGFLLRIQALPKFPSHTPLIFYLFIVSCLVIFLIIPFSMRYFFKMKKTSFLFLKFKKTLTYSLLSGDRYGSLSFLIKECRENTLVPRHLGTFESSIFFLFLRGGTLILSLITFFTLLKSYSSLSIGLDTIFNICFFAFISSFFLSTQGKGTFLILIGWIGAYYGNNIHLAYLNLLPIALMLEGLSCLLDTVISAYFIVGVSRKNHIQSHYLV